MGCDCSGCERSKRMKQLEGKMDRESKRRIRLANNPPTTYDMAPVISPSPKTESLIPDDTAANDGESVPLSPSHTSTSSDPTSTLSKDSLTDSKSKISKTQYNLAKETANQWKRKQIMTMLASKPRRATIPVERKRKKESRFDPDYQV